MLYDLLCGRPNRPHYVSCSFDGLSVCLSVRCVRISIAKKSAGNQKLIMWTFAKTRVSNAPFFSLKSEMPEFGLELRRTTAKCRLWGDIFISSFYIVTNSNAQNFCQKYFTHRNRVVREAYKVFIRKL